MPKVTVVIPHYNSSAHIDEAITSVFSSTFKDFEVIVVDDDSSDQKSLKYLKEYTKHDIKKIFLTSNQGPAFARNKGIEAAKGKYILALDSDDKIGKNFLKKSVGILDTNPTIGIVNFQTILFGNKKGLFKIPLYSDPKDFLTFNPFVVTSLFRKADWSRVGGYNANMKEGLEDYDFWLSLIEVGVGVRQLPDREFFYRIRSGSRQSNVTGKLDLELRKQIIRNHYKFFYNEESVAFLINKVNSLSYEIQKYSIINKLLTNSIKKIYRIFSIFPFIKKIMDYLR